MTDDNHETLARSLFSSEGKKPAQRRRPAKVTEPAVPPTGDPHPDLAHWQATAQAWENQYHLAQTELETLRPQLNTLQAQVQQQAKLIEDQQAALRFWQDKAQAVPQVPPQAPPLSTLPKLPTRPHQSLKPLAVAPKTQPPHSPDPLPDFMLD